MSFWLSHHRPEEWNRTYRLGSARVCARCLGTYPVALSLIAVQLARRFPLVSAWDGWLCLGLMLPAVLDWAVGRFRPGAGSNAWRTGTGVALGVALGRSLYVHLQRPFHPWLLGQAALVTGVVLPVILLSYLRRARD